MKMLRSQRQEQFVSSGISQAPRHEPGPLLQSDASSSGIAFQNVTQRFQKSGRVVEALNDVSFAVPKGRFVAVVGRSGCGKSTMLNLLAGIQTQSAGTISLNGEELRGIPDGVGYVTQHDTLLPWRTAKKNIAFPLEIRKIPDKERAARVQDLLDRTGLSTFGDHYPNELSGGMRQRVAIARSLVYSPSTLLMDEPFGALDALTRLELQSEFLRIWEESHPTVFFVTHDLIEAVALADEVIVMTPHPGRIRERIDINLPRPRDLASIHSDPAFGVLYQRTANALGISQGTVPGRSREDG